MRKILFLFIFVSLSLNSCKWNKLDNTYWIAVSSEAVPGNKGYGIYDGLIFYFKNDKLKLKETYSEKTQEFEIKFKGDKIYLNDSEFLKVIKQNQDSLIIDFNNTSRVKLKRLDDESALTPKPDIWKHKSWILSINEIKRELILTDSLFLDEKAKLCFQKDLQTNQILATFDKWKTLDVNGNQLFIKSLYQIDDEFFRLKSYQGDSIINLESLKSPSNKIYLKKREYISENKKKEIIKTIANKDWHIDEILKLDTLKTGGGSWSFPFIELEALKSKRLLYNFKDDLTYSIRNKSTLVKEGNWDLSLTGDKLILDNGLSHYDYIDIISLNSEEFVTGNIWWFKPNQIELVFDIEFYFKMRMKVNGG